MADHVLEAFGSGKGGLGPRIANCSGLIFSNFWAGTADQAKGFAQGMAQKFSELFADRNDCADPELRDEVRQVSFQT